MFVWEHGIAVHTMERNWTSSHGEGEISYIFTSFARKLAYLLELPLGRPLKTRVCSVMSGLLSSYEGNLRNIHEAWQGNTEASRGKAGDEDPFPVATVILGFQSIFKKSQASSPFESLNSTCLLRCHRDVRPPIQLRW